MNVNWLRNLTMLWLLTLVLNGGQRGIHGTEQINYLLLFICYFWSGWMTSDSLLVGINKTIKIIIRIIYNQMPWPLWGNPDQVGWNERKTTYFCSRKIHVTRPRKAIRGMPSNSITTIIIGFSSLNSHWNDRTLPMHQKNPLVISSTSFTLCLPFRSFTQCLT